MKICYLTWGETPRSYGVFGSQVLKQFVETKNQFQNCKFYFISGLPVIHSGLFREKFKYFKELDKIRKILSGIKFILIPIFFSQNIIYSNRFYFHFLRFGSEIILKKHLNKIKPDIIHCRSYYATWISVRLRDKFDLKYKIIFDARGLFPEEYALKRKITDTSKDYLFYKKIEKYIIEKSDLVVAVSDTMSNHFKELGAKNIECIYLSADTKNLFLNKSKKLNSNIIFGYIGALNEKSWHKTTELLNLYKVLKNCVKKSNLNIITTSNFKEIRNIFKEISNEDIHLKSTYTLEDLKAELGKFDFGLMSYFKPNNKFENTLSSMVLAVKSVEYLAAGLPIIINRKCGGIASIVEKYNLGITYDPDNFHGINTDKLLSFYNDGNSNYRQEIAFKLFDYKINAVKYKTIYEKII